MSLDTAEERRRRARWNRLSLMAMGAGVLALAAAAVLFALSTFSIIGGNRYSGPGTVTGFGDIYSVLTPQPTPTPQPDPPSDAPIANIVIPRFQVDAPVVVKGVDGTGTMEVPNGAWDVAWYDFSARPGFGSNAVFSGHVDYRGVGPAVFWNLKDLVQGDAVEVRLEDGTVYQYRVVATEQVNAATADVGKIVSPTPKEIVTLITCGGTFDSSSRQYDQRVIVRAERVLQPPAQAIPGAARSP